MSDRGKGGGWADLAAVLFVIGGIHNGIAGLSAIFKKEYFSESGLLDENLQTWGWVWLILGFLQLVAASLLIGVFMIKYRVELVLTFPLLAILFVWYLRVGLKPDSAAQHPERLFREKGLFFLVLLLAALMTVLLFVDLPGLRVLLSNSLLKLGI